MKVRDCLKTEAIINYNFNVQKYFLLDLILGFKKYQHMRDYKLGLHEVGFLTSCQNLALGLEFKKGSHRRKEI